MQESDYEQIWQASTPIGADGKPYSGYVVKSCDDLFKSISRFMIRSFMRSGKSGQWMVDEIRSQRMQAYVAFEASFCGNKNVEGW